MLCIPRTEPALMLRYWGDQAEETARCFRGDWFLTGDYARRDTDGYIYFLGRKDDLINTFGYRVSPHEVERVLKEHPDVADAAVVGDEVAPGKILVVAHVIRRPQSAITSNMLLAYAGKRLAAYKAPRIVHFADHLPRTRNGKILRHALRTARSTSA
jgi:acyl-coenzyme A synthetase/AMP-(fatty) acid ligase